MTEFLKEPMEKLPKKRKMLLKSAGILKRLKKLSLFYKQVAHLVEDGFPVNAYKDNKYSLIFMKGNESKNNKK